MKYVLVLSLIFLSACVGTDVIDDPIVDPILEVDQELVTLLKGETIQLTYTYLNEYGVEDNTLAEWLIEDVTIASANENGLITALKAGQTKAKAVINAIESNEVLISIVEDENSIVKVLIETPSKVQINVGETINFSSTAWNINDQLIQGTTHQWEVNNPSIAVIDNFGKLTGLSNGLVKVTAIIDGVRSVPLEIQVGTDERTGTFVSSGSYDAQGTAVLSKNSSGEVILTFSDDFKTSFALGTFIYLSNSISGSDTKASGLELDEITSNGAKTFNVTAIKANVTLDTYQYVIILCKPASITFGYAELN